MTADASRYSCKSTSVDGKPIEERIFCRNPLPNEGE